MAANGIYIYGIVPNFYGAEIFRSLGNAGVYAIPLQNISAIVSDIDPASLDFSDRETIARQLVHHQRTIEGVMSLGFIMILPMKLGTWVNTKEEVLTILAKGHDLFINSFSHIDNMMEIDLAITWADFVAVLKELANHPDIISLREKILRNSAGFSQADQVKTGMLVREKLQEKNKRVELKILDVLSSFTMNIKLHEVMNDQMITNSAFLISRNVKEKFDQIIEQLDEEYKGMLNFKVVGPLPCYSFYTIEVKELDQDKVIFAKHELGLNDDTSESVIKKAYLENVKLYHPDTHTDKVDEEKFDRINQAYHILLEYSLAVKQASEVKYASLLGDRHVHKMFLVKMKE